MTTQQQQIPSTQGPVGQAGGPDAQADWADPADEAMHAAERPRTTVVFGQIQAQAARWSIRRGAKRELFDPARHPADSARVFVDIVIYPLPGSPFARPIERNILVDSPAWIRYTLPSLKALQADIRFIDGLWAKVELIPTGRKYVNASGEEKIETAIVFRAIYGTETEAIEAQQAWAGQDQGQEAEHSDRPDAPAQLAQAAQAAQATQANQAERAIAAKFLPALWRGAGGDLDRFARAIAANPLTTKYFDLNSPEVIAIIQQAQANNQT